jgi:transposase
MAPKAGATATVLGDRMLNERSISIVRQRKALKDYYDGMMIEEIMRRYRISRSYIYMHLQRNKLPLRDKEFNARNLSAGQQAKRYPNG